MLRRLEEAGRHGLISDYCPQVADLRISGGVVEVGSVGTTCWVQAAGEDLISGSR